VNEWGFRDLRKEAVIATRELPIVAEITRSDVWDDQEESGGSVVDEEVKAHGGLD
jgi:hypothetical protein